MRRSLLVGLVLVPAACSPKPEAPAAATVSAEPAALSAAALDSVRAVDDAFAAGVNAKDTAAVLALYAPDAKVMPPDSPILEGAAAHQDIAGLIAGGASDMALKSTTVYGVGDLAYVVGTVSFTMGGAPQALKYAEVLRRGADGKWRLVVDMFSGVAPPAKKK